MNPDAIQDMISAAAEELSTAADAKEIEAIRVKYLGRKGIVQDLMKGLREASTEDRPRIGQAANELKQAVQRGIEQREAGLASREREDGPFDPTLPGVWRPLGSRHPISAIMEEVVEIFKGLGFSVADGPELETVYHNFDALNTPEDHPSRDQQDTFYLDTGELLRCHTSPVQVRYMETHRPPVRIVAPGRCYRRDTPDATHSANFHQVEGLYVDRCVSLADLKGDLTYMARRLLGPEAAVRFRPHFFPFTEPSVEVDFTCHVCGGTGCRVCKQSGWIEIMGAGMVDPNVFQSVGYDPEEVTGYAFGMGLERIAMILYGIQDIRMLYENDVRTLAQFPR
jgi:phenylalanyl-tRNA synthetase alpha chain